MAKGDPYVIIAKFGTCKTCGTPLKGKEAIFWPLPRVIYCKSCGEPDYRKARALIDDEERFSSGGDTQ